ncbi:MULTISPECIES: hypothetical protein [unclassified Xanthobacter]|uniref:hypothetical protein n=1 Tax=unclassified Xanthobacter TaxID=2623496 RepID=UPI001EE0D2B6|nr:MULTISPECIES: hypothetical protein [unclassified Xanthobacter]
MATFKLPLSGDVTQFFRLLTSNLAAVGNQIGFININLGSSKAPEVEEQVLDEVGSYGTQLGRINDALAVLVTHFHPQKPLTEKEIDALDGLRVMLNGIAEIKERHKRSAMRIPYGAGTGLR